MVDTLSHPSDRLAAKALELQTNGRFLQLADNLHIVLALANGDFSELLYVNRAYETIWGRTLEGFYAEPWSFLEGIHKNDLVPRVPGAVALGYVLKSDLAQCLFKAVNDASKRNRFLSPKVSKIVLDGFLRAEDQTVPLQASQVSPTLRETQVNKLLASGKTNKEIAAVLAITVRTVETRRAKIMLKLGVHSLGELIQYAVREGITVVEMSDPTA